MMFELIVSLSPLFASLVLLYGSYKRSSWQSDKKYDEIKMQIFNEGMEILHRDLESLPPLPEREPEALYDEADLVPNPGE